MPTWGWLLTAIGGATIVWAVPRLLSFAAHAFSNAVVDKLEERMEPRWSADFDDAINLALKPMCLELTKIRQEVTLNGGGSLKDLVLTVSRQVEDLLNTGGSR